MELGRNASRKAGIVVAVRREGRTDVHTTSHHRAGLTSLNPKGAISRQQLLDTRRKTLLLENGRHRSAAAVRQNKRINLRCFHPVVFKGRIPGAQTFVVKEEEKFVLDDRSAESARELPEGIGVSYRRLKTNTRGVATKPIERIKIRVVVQKHPSTMKCVSAALGDGLDVRPRTASIRCVVVVVKNGNLLHRFDAGSDNCRAAPLQAVYADAIHKVIVLSDSFPLCADRLLVLDLEDSSVGSPWPR